MNALRIAARSLVTYRRPLLIWTLAVGLLGFVQVLFWPSFRDSAAAGLDDLMANLPEAVRALFGDADLLTPEGFINARFGSIFPLLIAVYAAFRTTSETAADEQAGGYEVVLGAPVARWELLAGRFLAVAVSVAVIMAGLGLLTVLGAVLVSMDLALWRILAATTAMTFLGWALAGVTLAVAGVTGRRGVTLGAGAGLAVATYVWYSFAPLVEELADYRWLSPFQHAVGYDPVASGLQLAGSVGLVATAIAGLLIGAAAFGRRDVGV